jgi:hypothetical protein
VGFLKRISFFDEIKKKGIVVESLHAHVSVCFFDEEGVGLDEEELHEDRMHEKRSIASGYHTLHIYWVVGQLTTNQLILFVKRQHLLHHFAHLQMVVEVLKGYSPQVGQNLFIVDAHFLHFFAVEGGTVTEMFLQNHVLGEVAFSQLVIFAASAAQEGSI